MILHLHHADPIPVRLAEPPVIALHAADDLTVWKFIDDGAAVIRIGFGDQIGVDSITIERHHLRAVWVALRTCDEGEV